MARSTFSGSSGTDEYVAATSDTAVAVAPAVVDSLRRVSWGAVFAGVVLSLITQFLLSMLGVGIGVSTIDPATGNSPDATTFSISAAVWWTISGIIAAFIGGWTAGRLSGALATSAALHGLVTWATATLIVFYLLTTAAAGLIGGAFSFLGTTLSGVGDTVRSVAPQLADAVSGPLGDMRREIEGSIQNGSAADKARATQLVIRVMTTQDAPQQDVDQASNALAQQSGMQPQEARDRLNNWRETYQRNAAEIQARGRQTAEATAKTVSRAALFGFIALVLGAIAGALGGRSGAARRAVTTITA
jgi:hypothetical protein